ncbi:MAG: tyrosine-type recombinase/integrase [Desulfobacterales bacterium]|jgi:integrase/recombinase XerD|nr:tyrosine-type recombinase/integrase [Candidatus Latescibacterota bacterium]MBT7697581.1 tyrosine-type recombinase/integrase [Desulfobacterales bacterium]
MKPTDYAYHLTNYLGKYLPGILGLSTNTISSYRDMFKLMITFYETVIGIKPEKLTLKELTRQRMEKFLEWLEQHRGNSISTRNVRLAAVHAYAKYLARVNPDVIHEMMKLQSIPFKKSGKKIPEFISIKAMTLLLALPDVCSKNGIRDATLLSIMYDSGCRVQELCDLTVSDIRLQNPATVKVTGKGNRTRIIPIMDSMAKLLKQYLSEFAFLSPEKNALPLFSNRSGNKLTRKGVTYILQKYFAQAQEKNPGLFPKNISPHCLRHSKSMHLLQSGVDLIYIRDILGHVDVKTTEIYARIDSEMKRQSLEKSKKITPTVKEPVWQTNKELLAWLNNLGN